MIDHRILTVRQPWATPIIDGLKPVENRGPTFTTKYRGPLWIHAGARWDDDGLRSELVARHYLAPTTLARCYRDAGFTLGAILGLVFVVDAHHAELGCCPGNPWAVRDEGTVHIVFGPERYPVRGPVVPGALGIWRPDRVEGLATTLDHLVAGIHRHAPEGEFGIPTSIWPDLCQHPSATGDRCDVCFSPVSVPC